MEHTITKIKLGGLTCEACKKVIEKRLSKLDGVMEVNVSLANSVADITAMRPINVSEVTEALKGTEYQVLGVI